jgi:hypothetical protein
LTQELVPAGIDRNVLYFLINVVVHAGAILTPLVLGILLKIVNNGKIAHILNSFGGGI